MQTMPFERSAGAIIIRREGQEIRFLLLEYPRISETSTTYWDLSKGHIEKGEQELDAVRREVTEETGLTDIKILDGFTVAFYRKEWVKYSFRVGGKFITKVVTFYLAETNKKDVTISYEHTGYVWLLYEEAVNKLTFDNAKGILKKAHTFLQTRV